MMKTGLMRFLAAVLATASLATLGEVLAGLAPARTRVLRGYDSAVDRAVLPYEPGEPGRDHGLAQALSELRLVKDEWEDAELQTACDITTLGFTDSVAEWDRVVEHGEWREIGDFIVRRHAHSSERHGFRGGRAAPDCVASRGARSLRRGARVVVRPEL